MKKSVVFCRVCVFFLLFALLLPLSACSKYRLELSSKEEGEEMLTLADGTPVAFEVVRAFYDIYADAYPEEDYATRMGRVERGICSLYAIFSLCRTMGIDPNGKTMNEAMDAAVQDMIDAYDTRREYIEALKARHMTDTVSRLLLRSYLCEEKLLDAASAKLEGDATVLRAFCEREDVIRVLSMALYYTDAATESWARGRAEDIVRALGEAEDSDSGFLSVARRLATRDSEHTYITKDEWRRLCGDDGAEPTVGTVSRPLFAEGSCIIMRVTAKDLSYVEAHPAEIGESYAQVLLEEETERLLASLVRKDAYLALTEARFA